MGLEGQEIQGQACKISGGYGQGLLARKRHGSQRELTLGAMEQGWWPVYGPWGPGVGALGSQP